MRLLISFSPIFLFVLLFVGSGVYFSMTHTENAFYQIAPSVAIIPAIILAWILEKGSTKERFEHFINGVRHKDIVTMCLIFILAGAFSTITTSIGSVEATIHFGLSSISHEYLLIGLFLISAFISTAIGTSMGTIATIAPIAANLAELGAFPPAIGLATIVGGAMFGDNLSIISDTNIAAVSSQEADMRDKLKYNAKIALVAGITTVFILFFLGKSNGFIAPKDYQLGLITPYIFLVALALTGINVFIVLLVSIFYSGFIGFFYADYSLINFCKDIDKGFRSMQEILLLSLLVGGLSGLSQKGSKQLALKLGDWIQKRGSYRMAQLVIAKIVVIFDLLLANNTIAIIVSGEMARDIAKKYHIKPYISATWLATFSCVLQGILPYGAQLLLAGAIAHISPLEIVPHVYYCYILGAISLMMIATMKRRVKT